MKHQYQWKKCSLKFRSNLCEIKKVDCALKKFSKELRLTEDEQYKLLVAATEAVLNAIIHGNKSDERKEVGVTCYSFKRKIIVRVRDHGTGFDPTVLPDPTHRDNILKEHGRGVYLIRALMDEVRFKKLKTGLVVELVLKRKQ
ncbi:MAG: ATP-binding protein [Bacteroidetes bacterium]|nr:ATP-binding protein [Bacteroidota bacterium]